MDLKAVEYLERKLKENGQLSLDDMNAAKQIEYEQTAIAIKENQRITKPPVVIKKRTPLGELIRWAESNYLGFDKEAIKVINKAKELLPKEKETIIHAINNHVIKRKSSGRMVSYRLNGDEYYRRTFKNDL